MVRTLLVDDSEIFRASLGHLLTRRYVFMSLSEAPSFASALRVARRVRPDLIFADIRLNDGNGLELPRLLARCLPNAHVCMVTAYDLPEYREAARAAGARHFIPKGNATVEQISAIVESVMEGRVAAIVVDDNEPRRATLARALAKGWPRFMVLEAATLAQAILMIPPVRPILILARARALLDGSEPLAEAAARLWPRVLIGAICAHGEALDEAAARRRGADYVGPAGHRGTYLEPLISKAFAAMGSSL